MQSQSFKHRRVAAPLEDAVDNKLKTLLDQGIIEKVNGPSQNVTNGCCIKGERRCSNLHLHFAVLVQMDKQDEARIIMYASKSLSDIEKRYAQTAKEALALVWAVERFYFYLYGKEFDLITDHKPLEVIFSTKSKPGLRVERWVLRLQSFKYKIVYKTGKTNIADPLSR